MGGQSAWSPQLLPKSNSRGPLTAAARLEAGTVYWPKNEPWLGEWEAELLTFPNGRHDDQADCFAYAALQTSRHTLIDSEALAQALDQSELLNPPWPI